MGLTGLQWRFIANRLTTSTDQEAAEITGVAPATVSRWKSGSLEFAEQYETSFRDGVHVAMEIARQNLGKAANTLADALEAKDGRNPDYQARIAAAKLLFQSHGLLKDKVDLTSGGKSLRIVIDGSSDSTTDNGTGMAGAT